jgi:hypothetical protein
LLTGEGFHEEGFGEEHVHDIIAAAGPGRKHMFAKTPRLKGLIDSCRVFGSLDVNKVQGDFHITARGHGYQEWGHEHLDHSSKFVLFFLLILVICWSILEHCFPTDIRPSNEATQIQTKTSY